MKGIFINCPACKKMLMKNAYLRPGTYFDVKCFNCGEVIGVDCRSGRIQLKYHAPVDNNEDEDEDVIFVTI